MPLIQWYERDGADLYRHSIEDGTYYLQVANRPDSETLRQNAELRNSGRDGRLGQVGDARQALEFGSHGQYLAAVARARQHGFRLDHWDKDVKAREWRRFLQHRASKPYRTRERL